MGANCIRRAFEVGHNIKGEGWREPRSNLQRNYGGGIRRACDRHEVVWRGRAWGEGRGGGCWPEEVGGGGCWRVDVIKATMARSCSEVTWSTYGWFLYGFPQAWMTFSFRRVSVRICTGSRWWNERRELWGQKLIPLSLSLSFSHSQGGDGGGGCNRVNEK